MVQSSGRVLLIWDKMVFYQMDVMVGQFYVNGFLGGVVNGFVWAVQVCMALMMMVRGLLCGRSCQGCVIGGPWHGSW